MIDVMVDVMIDGMVQTMARDYPDPWILRTLLFTPGHRATLIAKAFASRADAIVLDLEDAVPEAGKEEARRGVSALLATGSDDRRPIFARINPPDSGHLQADLEAVASRRLAGFIHSKVCNAAELKFFATRLEDREEALGLERGHFEIIALMETPQAILNAQEIALASPRLVALLFGSEDFLTAMQGRHGAEGHSLQVPRHLVAMAARAAGIEAIDAPYVQVHDAEGLRRHATQARDLGFGGMVVLSPAQVATARELYTPAPEEIAQAQKVVELADQAVASLQGVALRGDLFVAPPTLRRARDLLQRQQAIFAFESDVLGP